VYWGGHYYQNHWFDELVIARSGSILVKNLSTGWKAKLYDASDTLIAQATESGGTATLDVSTQVYPITGRFKIYNASDVLQATFDLSDDIFGGDEYLYSSASATLAIETNYYIVNKTGATSPTSATITVTLKDSGGSPLSGKTITFSTSHGSVSPTSQSTDVNGQASTTFSASTRGLAIVVAEWAGDASNNRVYATIEVSVHEDADSPSSSKQYHVWVQGVNISNTTLVKITRSEGDDIASIVTQGLDTTVQGLYDLVIYRKGSAAFFGRIEVLKKSMSPTPTTSVQGRSMVRSLRRIPIESATYTAQNLKTMIQNVHADYISQGKQVLLGTIADSLSLITATVTAQKTTAYDLVAHIAKLGGAKVTVDADRKMNVA